MFRPHNASGQQPDTEPSLQYPSHFFISGGGTQFRCILCAARPILYSKLDAFHHEGSIEHIQARRDFDRPVPPPPMAIQAPSSGVNQAYIPSLGTAQAYSQYPIEMPTGPTFLSDVAGSSMHTQEPGSTAPPYSAETAGASWHSEMQQWSTSPAGYFAIPGPALPSDPPNTIYGLCGGAADQDQDPYPLSDDEDEDTLDAAQRSILQDPEAVLGVAQAVDPVNPSLEANSSGQEVRSSGFQTAPIAQVSLSDTSLEAWWPFQSQKECLPGLMTAFPRAVFSGKELEVVRWFAGKFGVSGLAANSTIQSRFEQLVAVLGLESRLVQSKLGNYFSVNSLCSIIANEMANPLVREQLVFYPQDDGSSLKQAANGRRWMEEVDPSLAAPMVRKYLAVGHHDYFIHEPFLASIAVNDQLPLDPTPLLPTRYFERSGVLFARSHRLIPKDSGYVINGDTHIDVPLSSFLLPFPEFLVEHTRYQMPCPSNIIGVQTPEGIQPWEYGTENPWRKKANGRIVRSVPIWLYCDDTSGNVSKKWNKHNSFLFTLAGLPREHSQRPYNVHFLATSNIATPLEMLEEITSELREARFNGFSAYDSAIGEDVLVIPWVYGIQGDNPMQSELCAHIGMGGKFFCRVCYVRGKDKDRADDQDGMVERIQEFMQINPALRHVSETVAHLKEQEAIALRGTFSVVDTEARKTGVKDKYLVAFLSLLKERYDKEKEHGVRRSSLEFLQKLRQNLPDRLYNPALIIPDLDANQDTPVEILHVILLGIAKYFWRDAVARQNQHGCEVLKARINSLDLTGLGLSKPHGTTLVQYAKSLNGGDFRTVIQIAPLVLYDLVTPPAYNAWLALSHLAPLAFQPEIEDVKEYLVSSIRFPPA
ncbi:hypothetical protein FS749_011115 [Ceratobasidium sp. UAMH 11750]|nr:hypothetical protein FS749_011115 [Ceratobasidium sp. UAMH 11750]